MKRIILAVCLLSVAVCVFGAAPQCSPIGIGGYNASSTSGATLGFAAITNTAAALNPCWTPTPMATVVTRTATPTATQTATLMVVDCYKITLTKTVKSHIYKNVPTDIKSFLYSVRYDWDDSYVYVYACTKKDLTSKLEKILNKKGVTWIKY